MNYNMNKIAAIGLTTAFLTNISPMTAHAEDTTAAALWAGVSVKNETVAGYAGGVWSPAGNLDENGFLLRAQLLYVASDYKTGLSPTGKAESKLRGASASVGYNWVGDGASVSLFGGIDFQDRDVNPSVAYNGKLDDDLGFIFTGRIATNGDTMYPASIEGTYSTANETYWTRARIGVKRETITFGPEIAALGNSEYKALQTGAHVSFELDKTILQFNGGYDFSEKSGSASASGKDGAYAGATIVFLF